MDHHDREALLEQFFDEASEEEDASMVEMGSSYDAPSTFARPFVRTDSANTDPLSAAGASDRHVAQKAHAPRLASGAVGAGGRSAALPTR